MNMQSWKSDLSWIGRIFSSVCAVGNWKSVCEANFREYFQIKWKIFPSHYSVYLPTVQDQRRYDFALLMHSSRLSSILAVIIAGREPTRWNVQKWCRRTREHPSFTGNAANKPAGAETTLTRWNPQTGSGLQWWHLHIVGSFTLHFHV